MLDRFGLPGLVNAWAAFSPPAMLAVLTGLGFIALAFGGLAFLPNFARRGLIALGSLLIVAGASFGSGHIQGAREATELAASRAQSAEDQRQARSDKIDRSQADRLTRDLARERADNAKLKRMLDEQGKDGARECLDGDDARRLRNL
ncbi:hypothetical protein [Methylorubrum extorquens]|uniref:hypothetical protein n=1 Tax=Methylorubrum extorquens TaxID=408 RepID=UPI00209EACFB|nr:hypothetical protein [Methylorubrum extorquens]MCP1540045.1 hypothetical protein [Methylorubrum extorquens]